MNLFVAQYSAQIRNIRVPENMVRILEMTFHMSYICDLFDHYELY